MNELNENQKKKHQKDLYIVWSIIKISKRTQKRVYYYKRVGKERYAKLCEKKRALKEKPL